MLTEQSVPPVGEKNRIVPGTLYLVATPIGNLSDISPRCRQTLAEADFIAAEDTRVSLKLLNHLELKKSLVSYHEHNKAESGEKILKLTKKVWSNRFIVETYDAAVDVDGDWTG